ncbi:MAG: LysM peptidoglycan-binding domain-containing protein [Vulcanibacillus sp.]
MREDFYQEEKESSIPDLFKDNVSLPPRSTIHTIRRPEKSNDKKIFRILFSSLVFIFIIAAIVYFMFFNNYNLFNSNQEIPEPPVIIEDNDMNNNIENQFNDDDTLIEVDEEAADTIEVEETTDLTDESTNQISPPINTDLIHIIQDGENLFRISEKYYGPGYMEALAKYNNITDIDKLKAGYELKIPSIDLLNLN